MITNRPRGTKDILPGHVEKWQYMEQTARDVCRRFHYQEIRTPIFEHTELFSRGVGEATDIVEKEMYTFTDRGDRSLSLRPEGTAGTVRAFVENKLYGSPQQPVKLYYMGPMFRYEKPQAGRDRQFHQFGIEVLGSDDPAVDAEVMGLAQTFYEDLGVKDLSLEINSVGCPTCRPVYRQKLMDFLGGIKHELCNDCNHRFDKNPMRILDCKVEKDQQLTKNAPTMVEYLCDDCQSHFDQVQSHLHTMGVEFVVNPRIVRGLDYYTKTAFEFIESGMTLCGGGRYNGLVQQVGGPDVPGIGFGAGMERALLAMDNQQAQIPDDNGLDVYLITLGQAANDRASGILMDLRRLGLAADKDYLARGMKAQMKSADRLQAKYVIILGEDELNQGVAMVKDMSNGQQVAVEIGQVGNYLQTLKGTGESHE